MTSIEEQEYEKCKNDILYFIEKYHKCLINRNIGMDKLTLSEQKKAFLKGVSDRNNKKIVTLGYRQSGKTSLCIAYALWRALFFPNTTIAFLSCRESVAFNILSNLIMSVECLPEWMNLGEKSEQYFIEYIFKNGSKILSVTAPESLAGIPIQIVIADEFAFFDGAREKAIADSFSQFVFSRQIILISSANKEGNVFHQVWQEANSGRASEWLPFEFSLKEKCKNPDEFEAFLKHLLTYLTVESIKQEYLNEFRPQ